MNSRIILWVLAGLLTSVCAWAGTSGYTFPFDNPYVATVVGTPRDVAAEPKPLRGANVRNFNLQVFEDRVKPDVFWYDRGLRTAVAYQDEKKAPLIFLIAGTGASFDSPKNRGMARAFYNKGFHVAAISSSTHPNFIISASSSGLPGHIVDDSRDIYRVMELMMKEMGDRIEVTDYYVAGYSLGGAQAAFVSKLDEENKAFNFKKVLMINPPVSLYNSVNILDKMLEDNIPGGLDNFDAFLERVMDTFTEVYRGGHVEFNDEFLYTVYRRRPPKDDEPLAALIGTSFRISSANMVFTSDVMTNSGYIVPKNRVLSRSEPLSGFSKVAHRITFLQYFDELLYPYYKSKQPGLQRQELLDRLSLRSIEDYLRNSEKIYVMHNADDLILKEGEIDFFTEVFGSRAKIYPTGGHCGNMDYEVNVDHMLGLFADAGAGK